MVCMGYFVWLGRKECVLVFLKMVRASKFMGRQTPSWTYANMKWNCYSHVGIWSSHEYLKCRNRKRKRKQLHLSAERLRKKNWTNLNASQPHTHKSTHMLDFARFNDGTTHSNVLRNRQEHFRCKKITIEDVEQFKSKRICQPNKRTNKRSTVLFIHYDAMQRTLNIPDRFSCLKDFEFRLRTKTRFS